MAREGNWTKRFFSGWIELEGTEEVCEVLRFTWVAEGR